VKISDRFTVQMLILLYSLDIPISRPDSDTGRHAEASEHTRNATDPSTVSRDIIGRILEVRDENMKAVTVATNWADNRTYPEKSEIGGHIDDLKYWNEHLVGMQNELSEKRPTWDHIDTAETR
jgi:hypothetical protein